MQNFVQCERSFCKNIFVINLYRNFKRKLPSDSIHQLFPLLFQTLGDFKCESPDFY